MEPVCARLSRCQRSQLVSCKSSKCTACSLQDSLLALKISRKWVSGGVKCFLPSSIQTMAIGFGGRKEKHKDHWSGTVDRAAIVLIVVLHPTTLCLFFPSLHKTFQRLALYAARLLFIASSAQSSLHILP